MKTKILNCSCVNEFQDSKYGRGKRVHNLSPDGKQAYCTVCVTRHTDKDAVDVPKNTAFGMTTSLKARLPRKAKNI